MQGNAYPANTRCWPNAGRRRHCANISPALGANLESTCVFAVYNEEATCIHIHTTQKMLKQFVYGY